MRFQGRHGYYDHELTTPQPFEVDVELAAQPPAGRDRRRPREDRRLRQRSTTPTRQIVESTSFRLLEALAEAISHEILADFAVDEVGVRIRKPKVELGGPLDHAAVEIWRRRPTRRAGAGTRRP